MICRWMLLQIRQYLCRPSSWIILILSVLMILLVREVDWGKEQDVQVLLYSDGSRVGDAVIENLSKANIDGFSFRKVESAEEVIKNVTRSQASSGVVFPSDLDRDMLKGRWKPGAVFFYQSAESLDGYVVKEVIYPYLMETASGYMLENYLQKSASDVSDSERQQILLDNADYLKNEKISIYETKELSGSGDSSLVEINQKSLDYSVGLWLLFVMILFEAGEIRMEHQNFYQVCRPLRRGILQLCAIFSNGCLTALLLGLFCFPEKLWLLLMMAFLTSVWTFLFEGIAGQRYTYLLPAVVILSLIVCPVVVDLSVFVPGLFWIGRIFPIPWFL